MSIRTVSRWGARLGYSGRWQIKKPTLAKQQKKCKLEFALKYYNLIQQWFEVLWSDEATFNVTCNYGRDVYRPKGRDPLDPQYTCGTTKHPNLLMVWVCFAVSLLSVLINL